MEPSKTKDHGPIQAKIVSSISAAAAASQRTSPTVTLLRMEIAAPLLISRADKPIAADLKLIHPFEYATTIELPKRLTPA